MVSHILLLKTSLKFTTHSNKNSGLFSYSNEEIASSNFWTFCIFNFSISAITKEIAYPKLFSSITWKSCNYLVRPHFSVLKKNFWEVACTFFNSNLKILTFLIFTILDEWIQNFSNFSYWKEFFIQNFFKSSNSTAHGLASSIAQKKF